MAILKPNQQRICIQGSCFWVSPFGGRPLIELPEVPLNEEEAGHYTHAISDASVLGAIHSAAKSISDASVRSALLGGITAAASAIEKRGAGDKIKITLPD